MARKILLINVQGWTANQHLLIGLGRALAGKSLRVVIIHNYAQWLFGDNTYGKTNYTVAHHMAGKCRLKQALYQDSQPSLFTSPLGNIDNVNNYSKQGFSACIEQLERLYDYILFAFDDIDLIPYGEGIYESLIFGTDSLASLDTMWSVLSLLSRSLNKQSVILSIDRKKHLKKIGEIARQLGNINVNLVGVLNGFCTRQDNERLIERDFSVIGDTLHNGRQ